MCKSEKVFTDVSCSRNNEPIPDIPKAVDKLCSRRMLEDCEALDKWIERGGDRLDGPASAE